MLRFLVGATDRGRTGTILLPRDFKSLASAYSATVACEIKACYYIAGYWRHHPDLNWGVKALQTSALPLGYGAEYGAGDEIRTRDICLGKATLYH